MKASTNRLTPATPRVARRHTGGFTLIELMIAMSLGLVAAAAALQLFALHLQGNRQLVMLVRLQQDMRTATDLLARHLRRAGYWNGAVQSPAGQANPNSGIAVVAGHGGSGTGAADSVGYAYSRSVQASPGGQLADDSVGWRLQAGSLQLKLGGSNWEQLTDAETMLVTEFAVTPSTLIVPLGQFCWPSCAASDPLCPTLTVRSFDIAVAAQALADSSVVRRLRQSVRVRNDNIADKPCP